MGWKRSFPDLSTLAISFGLRGLGLAWHSECYIEGVFFRVRVQWFFAVRGMWKTGIGRCSDGEFGGDLYTGVWN